jgi:cellulose 1,4-beta-cellobiosidase
MDIWEANKEAAAYTPHACKGQGLTRCEGTDCGDGDDRYSGVCDKDGCDFNSYRMGDQTFLGVGKTIDTSKVITVVTQFITADGTATGKLSAIRRSYVQGGKVISNSESKIAGVDATNEITDAFCDQQKTAFGDNNYFKTLGGMGGFSDALASPMVLSMSIWDDHAADMNWLDSTYPVGGTAPGNARGACDPLAGVPATVEAAHPDASVTFSNIRFGPIGSTTSGTNTNPGNPSTTTTAGNPSTSTTPPTTGGTAVKWGQCGGNGWTGPTVCASGSTCTVNNAWYSQCL